MGGGGRSVLQAVGEFQVVWPCLVASLLEHFPASYSILGNSNLQDPSMCQAVEEFAFVGAETQTRHHA